MKLRQLLRNTRGAAAIEFALAVPILASLMIGILQFALVFQASGAMRNASGEGIRYAKVHPSATASDVLAVVRNGLSGIDQDNLTSLTFVRGTQNGADYGRVSMSYSLQPLIPFISLPPIVLNETKFTYLPE